MDTPHFPSGRKIFYLFPQGDFHRAAVQHIIDSEYEIYTLSDHKRGLPLIFQYNGAIVFINLDATVKADQLLIGIRDFCRQTSNRSIALFLLCSSEEQQKQTESYVNDFSNCSTINYGDTEKEFSEILDITLDRLKARGQRSYVRFGTNTEEIAQISFKRKERTFQGALHDISSAGLSFSLKENINLPLRSKLREISLDLGYVVNDLAGQISIKRRLPNGQILYVLLFEKTLSQEIRQHLRFVIHASLQRQFIKRLEQVAVP